MNILIIIIGLLTERYWLHGFSKNRFYWFNLYCSWTKSKTSLLLYYLNKIQFLKKRKIHILEKLDVENEWLLIAIFLTPILLFNILILSLLQGLFFGFFKFITELALFCYLLGPDNYFCIKHEKEINLPASEYLMTINQQIVAVAFYFATLGPVFAVFYKLIYIMEKNNIAGEKSKAILEVLNWLPTRFTAFLCMIVGNFQKTIGYFMKHVLDNNISNHDFLQQILAHTLSFTLHDEKSLENTQKIVDYAFILMLLVMAISSLFL